MKSSSRPILLVAGFAVLGLAMALLIFGGALFGDRPSAEAPALPQIPQFTTPQVGVVQLGANSGEVLEVGDTAYDFSLNDLDGNLVSLSDFRGRPVMLNFWATWCGPCRIEMPELEQALHDYQDEELAILSINQEESREVVDDFFDELDLSLTPLLDSDGMIGELYSMPLLPATVFVDPEGQVTAIHRGMLDRAQIEQYLAETVASGG